MRLNAFCIFENKELTLRPILAWRKRKRKKWTPDIIIWTHSNKIKIIKKVNKNNLK